jgi:hypothetical protein
MKIARIKDLYYEVCDMPVGSGVCGTCYMWGGDKVALGGCNPAATDRTESSAVCHRLDAANRDAAHGSHYFKEIDQLRADMMLAAGRAELV